MLGTGRASPPVGRAAFKAVGTSDGVRWVRLLPLPPHKARKALIYKVFQQRSGLPWHKSLHKVSRPRRHRWPQAGRQAAAECQPATRPMEAGTGSRQRRLSHRLRGELAVAGRPWAHTSTIVDASSSLKEGWRQLSDSRCYDFLVILTDEISPLSPQAVWVLIRVAPYFRGH